MAPVQTREYDFVSRGLRWGGDDSDAFKAVLLRAGAYAPAGVASARVLADVPAAAFSARPAVHLTGLRHDKRHDDYYSDVVVFPGGVVRTDAAPPASGPQTISFAVDVGTVYDGVLIYRDGGTPETSELCWYINPGGGPPLVANGGDIIIDSSRDAAGGPRRFARFRPTRSK
jgi:hypothetical protein